MLAEKDEEIAALRSSLDSPVDVVARYVAIKDAEIAALKAAVAAGSGTPDPPGDLASASEGEDANPAREGPPTTPLGDMRPVLKSNAAVRHERNKKNPGRGGKERREKKATSELKPVKGRKKGKKRQVQVESAVE